MLAELEVGVKSSPASDGTELTGAAGRFGQFLVGHFLQARAEAVARGLSFSATTGAAGVAPGTAASTTPPMALWNPPESARNVIVTSVHVSQLSGTMGLGTIFAQQSLQTTVPSGGTELTTYETRLAGGGRSSARAFQGSTLSATPTLILPLVQVLAAGITNPQVDLDGNLIVRPGYALSLQETGAAGTSPVVFFGVTWVEVPA